MLMMVMMMLLMMTMVVHNDLDPMKLERRRVLKVMMAE